MSDPTAHADLLHQVASWTFIGGSVFGFFLAQLAAWLRCRWQDWRNPLPGGAHRHVSNVNRKWVSGAIVVLMVGVVTAQQQQAADAAQRSANQRERDAEEQRVFARSVLACFRDYGKALKGNVAIINEDNGLSLQQRKLLATRTKINTELAVVDGGDTVRRLYLTTQAAQLDAQLDAINQRQEQLDGDRRANPLPELTCGK